MYPSFFAFLNFLFFYEFILENVLFNSFRPHQIISPRKTPTTVLDSPSPHHTNHHSKSTLPYTSDSPPIQNTLTQKPTLSISDTGEGFFRINHFPTRPPIINLPTFRHKVPSNLCQPVKQEKHNGSSGNKFSAQDNSN